MSKQNIYEAVINRGGARDGALGLGMRVDVGRLDKSDIEREIEEKQRQLAVDAKPTFREVTVRILEVGAAEPNYDTMKDLAVDENKIPQNQIKAIAELNDRIFYSFVQDEAEAEEFQAFLTSKGIKFTHQGKGVGAITTRINYEEILKLPNTAISEFDKFFVQLEQDGDFQRAVANQVIELVLNLEEIINRNFPDPAKLAELKEARRATAEGGRLPAGQEPPSIFKQKYKNDNPNDVGGYIFYPLSIPGFEGVLGVSIDPISGEFEIIPDPRLARSYDFFLPHYALLIEALKKDPRLKDVFKEAEGVEQPYYVAPAGLYIDHLAIKAIDEKRAVLEKSLGENKEKEGALQQAAMDRLEEGYDQYIQEKSVADVEVQLVAQITGAKYVVIEQGYGIVTRTKPEALIEGVYAGGLRGAANNKTIYALSNYGTGSGGHWEIVSGKKEGDKIKYERTADRDKTRIRGVGNACGAYAVMRVLGQDSRDEAIKFAQDSKNEGFSDEEIATMIAALTNEKKQKRRSTTERSPQELAKATKFIQGLKIGAFTDQEIAEITKALTDGFDLTKDNGNLARRFVSIIVAQKMKADGASLGDIGLAVEDMMTRQIEQEDLRKAFEYFNVVVLRHDQIFQGDLLSFEDWALSTHFQVGPESLQKKTRLQNYAKVTVDGAEDVEVEACITNLEKDLREAHDLKISIKQLRERRDDKKITESAKKGSDEIKVLQLQHLEIFNDAAQLDTVTGATDLDLYFAFPDKDSLKNRCENDEVLVGKVYQNLAQDPTYAANYLDCVKKYLLACGYDSSKEPAFADAAALFKQNPDRFSKVIDSLMQLTQDNKVVLAGVTKEAQNQLFRDLQAFAVASGQIEGSVDAQYQPIFKKLEEVVKKLPPLKGSPPPKSAEKKIEVTVHLKDEGYEGEKDIYRTPVIAQKDKLYFSQGKELKEVQGAGVYYEVATENGATKAKFFTKEEAAADTEKDPAKKKKSWRDEVMKYYKGEIKEIPTPVVQAISVIALTAEQTRSGGRNG